jgi:glucose-1-phosphate thymidylyltransferase
MKNTPGTTFGDKEIVGVIPAGGQATRIAPLPCSKELYPVSFRPVDEGRSVRPKVVCHYLLESMRLADITKAFIVLREGKWDIPTYLGDGTMLDIHLAYLMVNLPYGAPFTVDQAYPFVQEAFVAFGFSDIIFQPQQVFFDLLNRQAATGAEIVLGLFPVDQPYKMDMVDVDETGRVRQIVIKPHQTDLRYTWIIAVWTPAFTHFMHEYLANIEGVQTQNVDSNNHLQRGELYVGDVVQAAIDAGLRVETVIFPDGWYIDIGTPEDLVMAVHNGVSQLT